MTRIGEKVRTDDFKNEKHVPVMEFPGGTKKGDAFQVKVSIGKEIPHPNTTAHHIAWISLYYIPDGGTFAYNLGRVDFLAHGATTDGGDSATLHANPFAVFEVRLDQPGELIATSYCNIHGIWENTAKLAL
ncbi:MAG: class II SORL domain-containing protein [bacterium]